jgi:hypothetical protein
MRIKDLEPAKLNEYVDTYNSDPVFSDADTDRILSVTEADFGPAMTSDDLSAHVRKLLGID